MLRNVSTASLRQHHIALRSATLETNKASTYLYPVGVIFVIVYTGSINVSLFHWKEQQITDASSEMIPS